MSGSDFRSIFSGFTFDEIPKPIAVTAQIFSIVGMVIGWHYRSLFGLFFARHFPDFHYEFSIFFSLFFNPAAGILVGGLIAMIAAVIIGLTCWLLISVIYHLFGGR